MVSSKSGRLLYESKPHPYFPPGPRPGGYLCGLRLLCQGLSPGAIQILRGITARVNRTRCIGCGKCVRECPASVITWEETAE